EFNLLTRVEQMRVGTIGAPGGRTCVLEITLVGIPVVHGEFEGINLIHGIAVTNSRDVLARDRRQFLGVDLHIEGRYPEVAAFVNLLKGGAAHSLDLRMDDSTRMGGNSSTVPGAITRGLSIWLKSAMRRHS